MNKSTQITPSPTEAQSKAILAVMPVSLLTEHKELAGYQERAYWASGELSMKLQELYYPEYSKAAIRKTVGEIYSIAINTVRDRERVSDAVPAALRNALPFLKFSHWRNIIPGGQERANNILWESAAMYEVEGKGPSVDQILAWRDSKMMDATPPWIYRLQDGLEKLEMVRDDSRSDPRIRLICEKTIEEIESRADLLKLHRFELEEKDESIDSV